MNILSRPAAFVPVYLLITGLICLLYSRTAGFDFSYDDFWQIHRNSLIVPVDGSAQSALNLFTTPTSPGDLYRPVTLLTYRITHDLFGLDPAPFHLFNLLLFSIVCCLAYRMFVGLVPHPQAACAAALLFAVHPVNVESVASIVGRAEMLAAFFGMAGALFFVRAGSALKAGPRWIWLLSALTSLVLGFMAKESALVFAALAPAYAFLVLRSQGGARASRFEKTAAIVLVVSAVGFYFLLRFSALGSFFIKAPYSGVIAENPLFHLGFRDRLIPALKILGDYLLTFLSPAGLSADYSRMPEALLREVYSPEGFSVLAVLIAFCMLLWSQRNHLWSFWGAWFLLAFSLTSNILFPSGTLMAERLAFTPAIGLSGFVVFGLQQLCSRGRVRRGTIIFLAALAFIMLSFRTLVRIPVWRNNVTLFSQSVLDAPLSPKAAFNLGVELARSGENGKAEAFFRRALQINPGHLPSARALADLLLQRRALARVEYWYRYILERNPQDKEVAEALERLLKLKAPPGDSAIAGPRPVS